MTLMNNPKVGHVLRARQTRLHHCHWPGCVLQVPPARWGCRDHWFALPKVIRDRIWRAYKPGQENTGNPSKAYVAAARAAQDWITSHLGAASRGNDHPAAEAATQGVLL